VSRVVSIDGELVPPSQSHVSVFDRGFLYGDGAFETLRVYGGHPFALAEHLARLERSAAAIRVPLPVPLETIAREIALAVAASGERECYARVMLTRGVGARAALLPAEGLVATRVVLVDGLALPDREAYAHGLRAITRPWGRGGDAGPASAAKLLPYVDRIVALQEARERGADEAIFVGGDGCLREATASNVFVVDREGRLLTPSEGAGVLGGITRRLVLELACSLGLSCAVRAVPAAILEEARGVFLTSSVREIVSVVAIDGQPIAGGVPGDVARTLHAALRLRAGATGRPPWE
jgi:branched-subunit amino acid aminotransferase/4-amino-4-deoxychorismate lyase